MPEVFRHPAPVRAGKRVRKRRRGRSYGTGFGSSLLFRCSSIPNFACMDVKLLKDAAVGLQKRTALPAE